MVLRQLGLSFQRENRMDWIIFSVMLLVRVISTNSTGLALMEGVSFPATKRQEAIHHLSVILSLLGILWGLIYLVWYWVIVIYIANIFLGGFIVKRDSAHLFFWLLYRHLLDYFIIVSCLSLWIVF